MNSPQLLELESIPWKIQRSPKNLSTLGSFSRCQVFMLIDVSHSDETIEALHIVYRQNEKLVEEVQVPIEVCKGNDRLIHTFAANAVVQDLEDAYDELNGLTNMPWLEQQDRLYNLKTEAENISCKWSLVSRWTNLFLTKPKDQGEINFQTTAEKVGIHRGGMGLLRERKQPHITTRTVSYATRQLLTEGEREVSAYDNITENSSGEDSEWNGFEDLPIGIIAPKSITAQSGTQADDRYEAESPGIIFEEQQPTISIPNAGKRHRSSIVSIQSDSSESSDRVRHDASRRKRPRSSGEEPTGRKHRLSKRTPMYRTNDYFVPRDGIDRWVITADIERYLGPGAWVKPGTFTHPETEQEIQGYYVTAYRNLTTAMIDDLKADSARWDQERRQMRHAEGHQKEKLQNERPNAETSDELQYVNVGAHLRGNYCITSSHERMRPSASSAYYPVVQYARGKRNSAPSVTDSYNNLPLGRPCRAPIPAPRNPEPENRQSQRLLAPSTSLLDRFHYLSIPEIGKQEDVIEDDTQQRRKKETLRKLLSAQNYDGSFSSRVADEIGGEPAELLSKGVTEFINARDLSHSTAGDVSLIGWTVVTIAWLERDFEDFERLWQLMRMKAHAYLRQSSYWNIDEEEEMWAIVKGLLPGVIVIPAEDPIATLYDTYHV